MEIKLYNTLTHSKSTFKSIEKNKVKMYTCGPTVYNYASIGNFRAYIFADLLKRMFQYNGYEVESVMNITDVGHLTSDADTGEDKMIKASKREGKDPYEIAKYYTDVFLKDFHLLNLQDPTVITKATDNINEMLKMVKEIVANGYGYETSKAIYFDVSKLDKYPVLSNNITDDQKAGARVEVDPEKRNPYDFAIWIKAPENHLMKWDSPWGPSYPGWHLECSTMSRRFLGEHFDIHTGGIDHIPIHHENEIAQCKGAFGHNPANYWMHCEFLLIDGGKMSKSLNNVYTLNDLKDNGIEPLAYKLFCYNSHYKNKLNFTFEGARASQVALNRLRLGYNEHFNGKDDVDEKTIKKYKDRFTSSLNDDLNIMEGMAVVWEIIKLPNKSKKYAELLLDFDRVLGLDLINSNKYISKDENIPDKIIKLAENRKEAKKNKDYKKADEIRETISNQGYNIVDINDGGYKIESK